MEALIPVVTDDGLQHLINADNNGLQGKVAHIAFGDGGSSQGSYEPDVAQTALRRERVRIPVAGGERIGPFEIMVQGLLDTGPTFNVNEVGFVLDNGTFLSIWSTPGRTLFQKSEGVPVAVAYNLALSGIPAGSIALNVSGPSVNLSVVGPIAQTAASFMLTWRRMVQSDVDQFTPKILKKWR
jgi:hypothetical protein